MFMLFFAVNSCCCFVVVFACLFYVLLFFFLLWYEFKYKIRMKYTITRRECFFVKLFIILLVQFGWLSGHLLGNSCPLG